MKNVLPSTIMKTALFDLRHIVSFYQRQMICVLLCLICAYSKTLGQVNNDDLKYYDLQSLKFTATNNFDSWGSSDQITFYIKTAPDINGSSTKLMNFTWNTDPNYDKIVYWSANLSSQLTRSEHLFNRSLENNYSGTTNTSIDLEFQMVNNHPNHGSWEYPEINMACGFLNGDYCHDKKYSRDLNLVDAADGPPNRWNYILLKHYVDNEKRGEMDIRHAWRYKNGNTSSNGNPLNFGTLSGSGFLSHINSNRRAPSGTNSIIGYSNNYDSTNGQNSADVFYEFGLSSNTSKRLVISTDHAETNYDTYIHLLEERNGTISHITSNDDGGSGSKSKISIDLCGESGTKYFIVVEGFSTNSGDFKLSLEYEDIPSSAVEAGSIAAPISSACQGTNIGVINGSTVNSTIEGADVSYEWEINSNSIWQNTGVTTKDLPQESSGTMGSQNLLYRRRTVVCGVKSDWTVTQIDIEQGSASPGFISIASFLTTIPSGTGPGMINSNDPGSANPAPISYQWQVDSGSGFTDLSGAISETYIIPILENPTNSIQTYKYRRLAFSSCGGAGAPTNVIEILVVPSNGIISGKVMSPIGLNGESAGVSGVTITVERTSTVPGGFLTDNSWTAMTNTAGEYQVPNIYYGPNNATFKITPSFVDNGVQHVFDPPELIDKLLANSAPSLPNQDFIDQTSFAYSGKVFQVLEGDTCAMDSVDILLDDIQAGQTGPDGTYSISIPSIGTHKVQAVFPSQAGADAHTFLPVLYEEFVSKNTSGRDFHNLEMNTISGFFGGNCSTIIGTTDVKFTSQDNCFVKTITTNPNGTYSVSLPANIYDVQLENIALDANSSFNELELEAFFNAVVEVDLLQRNTDKALDFIYRPQPVIRVSGWPVAPCPTFDIIVEQLSQIELTLEIFEGVLDGCPVDTGRIIITDNISDLGSEMVTVNFSNGMAKYTIVPGDPNIISPHFKNLSITAEDTLGQFSDSYTQNVIVTGARSRTQTFATVSPELPTLILRDPPGDASFSCVETGQSNQVTTRFFNKKSAEVNTWSEVKVGTKFESGIGFSVETEIGASIKSTLDVVDSQTNTTEYVRTISSAEQFCTSDDNLVTGDFGGDVYIGGAMNMLYSLADVIDIDENCNVIADTILVIKNEGYATEYMYTEKFIKDRLIPDLSLLKTTTNNQDSVRYYANQIDVWQQVIQRNQELKDNAEFVENLSISSNVTFDKTTTQTTSSSLTLEFLMEIEAGIAAEAGVEIAGNGVAAGVNALMKMETGSSTEGVTLQSYTTSYHIEDNNGNSGVFADDAFSIDVKADKVYKTPVFEFVAGSTSCPWEPESQMRDNPKLTVQNPVVTDIPQGDVGEFTLILENLSETNEQRTYYLQIDANTNLNNATITLGGVAFPGGIGTPFTIPANSSIPVDISVAQGTSTVYSYEGIKFRLYPLCEISGDGTAATLASEATVSAFFTPPCSEIALFEPVNGWVLNATSNNLMDIHLKDYDKSSLDQIQLEYAPAGTSNFQLLQTVAAADLNENLPNGTNLGTIISSLFNNVPDGNYDLRARLICGKSTVFSQRANGVIDRLAPVVVGLPEPSDDHFDSGDQISVQFNETIICDLMTTVELLNLATGQTITAGWTCHNNQANIFTAGTNLLDFGDALYQARLNNVSDAQGNTASSVQWEFRVGDENVFVCAPLIANQNDVCTNAVPIACGQSITANSSCARPTDLTDCLNSTPGGPLATISAKSLWYSFSGTGSEVLLSTCAGSEFNSAIYVYAGECFSKSCIAADKGTCGVLNGFIQLGGNQSSELVISTEIGTEYLVAVAGEYFSKGEEIIDESGEFILVMSCLETCPQTQNLNNNPEPLGLYVASDTINSRSTLSPEGGLVHYSAGKEINLLPDFEVKSGLEFHFYIEGCDPN